MESLLESIYDAFTGRTAIIILLNRMEKNVKIREDKAKLCHLIIRKCFS